MYFHSVAFLHLKDLCYAWENYFFYLYQQMWKAYVMLFTHVLKNSEPSNQRAYRHNIKC